MHSLKLYCGNTFEFPSFRDEVPGVFLKAFNQFELKFLIRVNKMNFFCLQKWVFHCEIYSENRIKTNSQFQDIGHKDRHRCGRPFLSTFFRTTKLIFRALPEHYKDPILTFFFAPQANLKQNKSKMQFLGTCWKILSRK